MSPSAFFLDLVTAVVFYIAFVVGIVAVVGCVAEFLHRIQR